MNQVSLKQLNFGTDEHRIAVRNKMPEPTRVPNTEYYSMQLTRPQWLYEEGNPVDWTPVPRDTWVKILVNLEGARFWAWKCLTDGKIYI